MERDGDLAFVAGERVDDLSLTFPDGNLLEMPSTNQVVKKAVEFTQGTPHECAEDNIPIPQHRTAAKVAAAVPRPQRAARAAQAARAALFHMKQLHISSNGKPKRLWRYLEQPRTKLNKPQHMDRLKQMQSMPRQTGKERPPRKMKQNGRLILPLA
jgi:hypothetical protein